MAMCRSSQGAGQRIVDALDFERRWRLASQLPFVEFSESMGDHDSKVVDAGSVD